VFSFGRNPRSASIRIGVQHGPERALYKEQWAKLLEMADDIRAFISENESKLKAKGE
jgi:hypothetical protein